MKNTELLKNIIFFSISSFIICLPSLYNGYPIMYFDSGNYIAQSVSLEAGDLNPIGYPLFVRAFSWRFSLWPVVFAQGLLLSVLIYFSLKTIFKGKKIWPIHFIIVGILSLCTGIGWFASLIMADVFAPVMILSVYLFFTPGTSKPVKTFAFISMAFAATTHFSTQYLVVCIAIGLMVFGKFVSNYSYKQLLVKGVFLLLIYVISAAFINTYNYADGKGFKSTNRRHVILMARLMETGILDDFLEKNCEDGRYALCNYKDQFPNRVSQFVWDKESILKKTGNWEGSEEEYKEILHEVFTDPSYLLMFGYKSLMSTFVQLATFKLDVIHIKKDVGPNYWIKKEFKHEEKAYQTSLQSYSRLTLDSLNMLYYLLCGISLILIIVYLQKNSKNKDIDLHILIAVVLLGLIFNAAINGTFSNVVVRYQARVNWLLVFAGLVLVIKYLPKIKINIES